MIYKLILIIVQCNVNLVASECALFVSLTLVSALIKNANTIMLFVNKFYISSNMHICLLVELTHKNHFPSIFFNLGTVLGVD